MSSMDNHRRRSRRGNHKKQAAFGNMRRRAHPSRSVNVKMMDWRKPLELIRRMVNPGRNPEKE